MMKMSEEQLNAVRGDITAHVPRCDDMMIKMVIGECLDKFVRDIGGIVMFAPLCGEQGGRFHVDAPWGGRVLNVRDVFSDGRKIDRMMYQSFADDDGCGHIHFHFPVANRRMTAQVEWEPSDNTPELPHGWFSQHRSAIGHAALARPLAMTDRPWGSPQTAAIYASEYVDDVNDALVKLAVAGEQGNRLSMYDANSPWVPGL